MSLLQMITAAKNKRAQQSAKRKKEASDVPAEGNVAASSSSSSAVSKKVGTNDRQKRRRVHDSDAEGQSSAEGDRVANQGDSVGDKSEDNPQIFKEVTTKKGLKWIDLRIGEGPQRPTKGRAVKIYYTGYLNHGTPEESIFDSSDGERKPGKDQKCYESEPLRPHEKSSKVAQASVEPSTHNNAPFCWIYGKSTVIKGLELGMKGMLEGGHRRITIPPKLAYGNAGTKRVPPKSVLTFDVELLGIGSHRS